MCLSKSLKHLYQSDEQVIGAETDDSELNNLPTSRIATAQLHLQSKIDFLKYDLVGLYERRNHEMLTQEQDVELKEKKKKTRLIGKQVEKEKKVIKKEHRKQEMKKETN